LIDLSREERRRGWRRRIVRGWRTREEKVMEEIQERNEEKERKLTW
jgi:hypothetical protein